MRRFTLSGAQFLYENLSFSNDGSWLRQTRAGGANSFGGRRCSGLQVLDPEHEYATELLDQRQQAVARNQDDQVGLLDEAYRDQFDCSRRHAFGGWRDLRFQPFCLGWYSVSAKLLPISTRADMHFFPTPREPIRTSHTTLSMAVSSSGRWLAVASLNHAGSPSLSRFGMHAVVNSRSSVRVVAIVDCVC